jgi:uncharacterized integral membrane protein
VLQNSDSPARNREGRERTTMAVGLVAVVVAILMLLLALLVISYTISAQYPNPSSLSFQNSQYIGVKTYSIPGPLGLGQYDVAVYRMSNTKFESVNVTITYGKQYIGKNMTILIAPACHGNGCGEVADWYVVTKTVPQNGTLYISIPRSAIVNAPMECGVGLCPISIGNSDLYFGSETVLSNPPWYIQSPLLVVLLFVGVAGIIIVLARSFVGSPGGGSDAVLLAAGKAGGT